MEVVQFWPLLITPASPFASAELRYVIDRLAPSLSPFNDPKHKTKAWVIYERLRSEREADRRLGRFVAYRLEDVKLPPRVLKEHGL